MTMNHEMGMGVSNTLFVESYLVRHEQWHETLDATLERFQM